MVDVDGGRVRRRKRKRSTLRRQLEAKGSMLLTCLQFEPRYPLQAIHDGDGHGHGPRQALRKLWRSDSVFANLDGLIDYGEDFTDAATVVEGMKSVYTVGRGMVDYEAEEAAKRAAEEAEAAESQELAQADDETVDTVADDPSAGDETGTDDEEMTARNSESKTEEADLGD